MNEENKIRKIFGSNIVAGVALLLSVPGWVLLSGASAPALSEGETVTRSGPRPMTVRDAIETVRLQGGPLTVHEAADGTEEWGVDPVVVSPDGRRYAFEAVRGDVARDEVVAQILVGGLTSIADAAKIKLVATLITDGKGAAEAPKHGYASLPGLSPLRWIDNDELVLLWNDKNGVVQVFEVNGDGGEVSQRTFSQTDVVSFAATADGPVVFSAKRATSLPEAKGHAASSFSLGYVVEGPDALAVLEGDIASGGTLGRDLDSDWFVSGKGTAVSRIVLNGGGSNEFPTFLAKISPNRALAIVDGSVKYIPLEWIKYQGLMGTVISQRRNHQGGSLTGRQLKQLFVVDLARKSARPLWNAPSWAGLDPDSVSWSPDGTEIAIAPSFLPPDRSEKNGLDGKAAAIVNVTTSVYQELPLSSRVHFPSDTTRWNWVKPDEIELLADDLDYSFLRIKGRWEAQATRRPVNGRISVRLVQDMNIPPTLVAFDSTAKNQRTVFDPNPRLLKDFELGLARPLHWSDQGGRAWSGRLYLPPSYDQRVRYPLVIQTHGLPARGEFSIYGHPPVGSGPGGGTYAAQVLAGRNILVLQLEDKQLPRSESCREAQIYTGAYESVVAKLSREGIIDPTKVGLLGFSRTAWHVQYALSHSKVKYAAAVASDGISGGYVEATLSPAGSLSAENCGEPFGATLPAWLRSAPPFNAEHVHTPLRIQLESGPLTAGILANWEMFSRLRQLGNPVELFVAPDIEHGSHGVSNPAQELAIAGGMVDWFDFWMNGHVEQNSGNADEYQRWRTLATVGAGETR